MSENYAETEPEASEDEFFLMSGLTKFSPALQGEPFASANLGLLIWMASHGRTVIVHFDDLAEGTGIHPRRIRASLRKLESAGHIAISGSGSIRTIEVISEFVRTSGEWVSNRATFRWTTGSSKWRTSVISADLRRKVFDRDGAVCAYCGDTAGPFHIDHRLPVAKGGKDTMNNLTVACASCNLSKGAKTGSDWKGRK